MAEWNDPKSEYFGIEIEKNLQTDMLYAKRPLHEHLISSLKILGKFSIGAIVLGGAVWLAGNAIIDALSQPIPITFSSLALKEMVSGLSIGCGFAGGLTTAIYFSPSHN